jgi:hypothetical protein
MWVAEKLDWKGLMTSVIYVFTHHYSAGGHNISTALFNNKNNPHTGNQCQSCG